MSRWSTMPRAYRRQLQATDLERVAELTRTSTPDDLPTGSAGRLRGIPAIGKGVPGAIRNTRPGDTLK